jgi:hypothetical protein
MKNAGLICLLCSIGMPVVFFANLELYRVYSTTLESLTIGVLLASLAVSIVPVLTKLNPNSGPQGQQNLSVAITGPNTHFAQGVTTASFGAAIAVASLTVNSAMTAAAVINIDPAAGIGPRNVMLATNTEVAVLTNGFTITLPMITTVAVSCTPEACSLGGRVRASQPSE